MVALNETEEAAWTRLRPRDWNPVDLIFTHLCGVTSGSIDIDLPLFGDERPRIGVKHSGRRVSGIGKVTGPRAELRLRGADQTITYVQEVYVNILEMRKTSVHEGEESFGHGVVLAMEECLTPDEWIDVAPTAYLELALPTEEFELVWSVVERRGHEVEMRVILEGDSDDSFGEGPFNLTIRPDGRSRVIFNYISTRASYLSPLLEDVVDDTDIAIRDESQQVELDTLETLQSIVRNLVSLRNSIGFLVFLVLILAVGSFF